MIFGIGTDLVDVEKLKMQLSENESLSAHIFTPAEIQYCETRSSRDQNYAARLAAKEAFLKALGIDLQQRHLLTEIEVSNEENGRPLINLTGNTSEMFETKKIKQIHLSISHIKSLASAIVILEK